MAVVTIGHHPELTKEEAFKIFQRRFGDKYTCQTDVPRGRRADFVIIKSGWTGVLVRLEQEPETTKFVFAGYAPTWYAMLALAMTLGALSLLVWTALTNEVKTFIREAPEFK